ILTCQCSAKCSSSSEMSGASPGRRNVSRYILSASSILVLPKNKYINWKGDDKWASHLTKASRTLRFLRLEMYSPILFLSSCELSLRKWATSAGSRGSLSKPCSWRNSMPLLGRVLKCSVPDASS
ncbi:unnamed protein product, partial [Ixodes pacificus]